MTDASSRWLEFDLLLDRVLDGLYSEMDLRRLNETLRANLDACQRYIRYIDLHGRLVWGNGQGMGSSPRSSNPQSSIPKPFFPDPSPTLHAPLFTLHSFVGSAVFSYSIAALILGVGVLIAWAWKLNDAPQIAQQSLPPAGEYQREPEAKKEGVFVGRITGMVDCRWEKGSGFRVQGSRAANPPSFVALGDKYFLTSGLLQITYNTGAKVILQGPVTYKVESATGGFLTVGKLTAKLESAKSQAANPQSPIPNLSSLSTAHSPLFTIKTPTATVTDLGTEFGVEVNGEGYTTSHVFRGTVEVQPIAGGRQHGQAIRLRENESAHVERQSGSEGLTVRRGAAAPQAFVRQLVPPSKVIDLLDIVAGGDGAGHQRERGIDPCNGMEEPVFLGTMRPSDRKYHHTFYAMIDGVFVPEGSQGPTQIDSAGHTFSFPKTTGDSVGPIWPRAVDVHAESRSPETGYWIHIGDFGKEFMPERRGLLGMHSNVGITFDLDAIRKACGGRQFNRFRAATGKDIETLADLWVLVDGRLVWSALNIRKSSGVSRGDVAIRPSDRFLTLVVTDGGDGPIGGDWAVFGDPVLDTAIPDPTPQQDQASVKDRNK